MHTKKFLFIFLTSLAFSLAACDILISKTQSTSPEVTIPKATDTAVAQTVIAQVTDAAKNASLPPTLIAPSVLPSTATLAPSSTPIPTITPVPPLHTLTPYPTFTPFPTYTPYPTQTVIPCHQLQFVVDITVPDGTGLIPGETFIKTWRLKNTGSCTWTTDYELVYMGGDRMSGKSAASLPQKVTPGQTADISVQLTAPERAGIYQGYWQLQSPDGKTFGIGENANQSFWVKIVVLDSDNNQPFSFVTSACKAKWTSRYGPLQCPGTATDHQGFIQFLPEPVMENGKKENEPALWVHPEYIQDGWIQVEYPEFQVYPDDKFVTIVGCLNEARNCKVIFTLSYRTEIGNIKTLATWTEVYDGEVTKVSVDLSAPAGLKVSFILRVDAWGNADGDQAFWLNPHISGLPRMDQIPYCPKCK